MILINITNTEQIIVATVTVRNTKYIYDLIQNKDSNLFPFNVKWTDLGYRLRED